MGTLAAQRLSKEAHWLDDGHPELGEPSPEYILYEFEPLPPPPDGGGELDGAGGALDVYVGAEAEGAAGAPDVGEGAADSGGEL